MNNFSTRYNKTVSPVHWAGFISALLYLGLNFFSRNTDLGLSVFFSLSLAAFLLTLSLYFYLERYKLRITLAQLFGWSIILRVIGVLSLPFYEDDFYRYLWDGYQFFERGSPYGIAPSEAFLDESLPEPLQSVLDGINYPDIPTIYGPALEYSFLLAYLIKPASVFVLQILYALLDLLVIFILTRLTSINKVLLYAWSPLIIKEIAITAHPDIIGSLCLLLALFFLARKQLIASATFLAISVCAKIFACLFIPFLIYHYLNRARLWFVAVVFLLYMPFLFNGASDFPGLLAFVQHWQFNASLYALLATSLPHDLSKLISLAVFLSFYSFYWVYYIRHKTQTPFLSAVTGSINRAATTTAFSVPRGDWIFGVFFLCAPVVNPWYLVWLLPFGILTPSVWLWVASYSVLLSYSIGLNLQNAELAPYQQPVWIWGLEYALIALALGVDVYRNKVLPKVKSA